ncbi:hypothetical protein Purlil1_6027 [Purpureocillium lilacinum]|uniref:Uncharacterized protein n=1 Tax=Purpureocillium lilacinum TaxID=33203 RepID=A0ABR0BZD5_PURLI|nr:hypothetical protein Purlil1_6027 [Purpureocillium lilacinum]
MRRGRRRFKYGAVLDASWALRPHPSEAPVDSGREQQRAGRLRDDDDGARGKPVPRRWCHASPSARKGSPTRWVSMAATGVQRRRSPLWLRVPAAQPSPTQPSSWWVTAVAQRASGVSWLNRNGRHDGACVSECLSSAIWLGGKRRRRVWVLAMPSHARWRGAKCARTYTNSS